MNEYAKDKNIIIEHYIISSGLRDILKGTSIHRHFKKVFASGYMYDANDVAVWPALAIDYTNKTQFLFRINKGIVNSWDNSKINKYILESERHIPFSRMIYIGDGETDVPAMKMVNYQGGTSIAVYNPNTRTKAGKKAKKNCEELLKQKRATYIAPARYTEDSELFEIIRLCIDQISTKVDLSKFSK
nr:HAD family hydrolase [Ornithobacterium rhinotracheale]